MDNNNIDTPPNQMSFTFSLLDIAKLFSDGRIYENDTADYDNHEYARVLLDAVSKIKDIVPNDKEFLQTKVKSMRKSLQQDQKQDVQIAKLDLPTLFQGSV